ncbi:MAG: hypothetical protein ABUS79_20470 [Pseudomonadota bacterium]
MQIFVEAEESITDGLVPGSDLENIQDGWTVAVEKFLITLGNVRIAHGGSSGGNDALDDPKLQVIDMKTLAASGLLLATFKDIDAIRWDKVGYDQGYASATAVRPDGTAQADFDMMVAGGFSLYVSGSMTKPGQPTVSYAWGLRSGVTWSDCGPPMGDKGFAVSAGGTTQVKATIHGDHWFFNNFPEADEETKRLAQWIADVDAMTGGDHQVTAADLALVPASAVFPAPRYSLQNALGAPIASALDYVTTQARTIGHLQGEGECGSLAPL